MQSMDKFLHALPDAKQLFEVVAKEKKVLPIIVEKDYWLMHCLWRLQQKNHGFPTDFLRHHYDVYQLLNQKRIDKL